MRLFHQFIQGSLKFLSGKGIIVIYAVIASGGLIALKLGTSGELLNLVDGHVNVNINAFAIVGIISYGISFLLYLVLISRYDLGIIVSLTASLVYLIVFLASFFIFGEDFTLLKVAAICLILGGLLVMNSTSTGEKNKSKSSFRHNSANKRK